MSEQDKTRTLDRSGRQLNVLISEPQGIVGENQFERGAELEVEG